MLTAHWLESICATSTPGAIRRTSGMLVAPERRMSSWLITKTAAPVLDSVCSFFETEVTSMLNRSSKLAPARFCAEGVCAVILPGTDRATKTAILKMHDVITRYPALLPKAGTAALTDCILLLWLASLDLPESATQR